MAKSVKDHLVDKERLAPLEFGAIFRARPRRRYFQPLPLLRISPFEKQEGNKKENTQK